MSFLFPKLLIRNKRKVTRSQDKLNGAIRKVNIQNNNKNKNYQRETSATFNNLM